MSGYWAAFATNPDQAAFYRAVKQQHPDRPHQASSAVTVKKVKTPDEYQPGAFSTFMPWSGLDSLYY